MLGQYDLSLFDGVKYGDLGKVLTIFFGLFVIILLMNLLIARMAVNKPVNGLH